MSRRPLRPAIAVAVLLVACVAPSAGAAPTTPYAATPDAATPTPPAAAPSPTPYAYTVHGAAHIRAADSHVNVPTTVLSASFLPDGRFSGELPVPATKAHFLLFGRPAVATVTFSERGQVTGSLFTTSHGDALTATGRYTMRLSHAVADGRPVALGPHCETVAPVTMTASTPIGGSFSRDTGGHLTGSFTIGGFRGCQGYETAIDRTISGAGNFLSLELTRPTP